MRRLILYMAAFLLTSFIHADVIVNPTQEIGPIKPMNGVNNGPAGPYGLGTSQTRDNFEDYRAANIPFARTHDAAFSECYGSEHTVDITSIFPDFSKNADDPQSYDFAITDWYLNRIREMGTEVFFRLGQKIEHHVKKYGIIPPADFKKWAIICEHIIRHYNEGWANGHQWNIRYWEIWNEADLDLKTWNTNPRTWAGTQEQFFDFFTIAAKHLKKKFPKLHIGGPALAGNEQWADNFFAHLKKENVPLDFFSWHIYSTSPGKIIRGWTDDYPYSLKTVHGLKGGAFTAATMTACQNKPVDILMYYDARPETPYNGLFDFYTYQPLPSYYSFYAWSRLASLGKQIQASTEEEDLYVVAAKGEDGSIKTWVTRYNENDNINRSKTVKIHIEGIQDGEATAHVVDSGKLYSETVLRIINGTITVKMEPNSFIVIDCKL